MKTPRKKKIAFYTPSKKKIRVLKKDVKKDKIESVPDMGSKNRAAGSRVGKKGRVVIKSKKGADGPAKESAVPAKESTVPAKSECADNEIVQIENELLSAYREENAYLRSLVSSHKQNITGFTVEQPEENQFVISYSAYDRTICFRLVKNGDCYEYELIRHVKVELPDFLMEELIFSEEQLPKFFFNLMQVMVGKD